jgi:hypothetical protein
MQQITNAFLRLWSARLILLLWGLFVILDYLFHHPYYEKALLECQYWGLLSLLLLLLGASWFFIFRLKKKAVEGKKNQKEYGSIRINGLSLYLLLLSLMVLTYGYYCSANDLFTNNPLSHLVYFLGHTAMLHGFILLMVLMAFAFGAPVLNGVKKHYSPASFKFISLAVGLSLMGIIAVLLGLLGVLTPMALWLVLLSGLILSYKTLLPFLRSLLLESISFRLGWQGLLTAGVLYIFIVVNSIGALKNFPAGFDGANLYMNISKLIVEYQALPEGGQAFNWSVIMSFGDLLFNNTAVSILLSHLAGILCLIAVFRIARLFMSADKSLMAATIFYIAPYISFHNISDEKVDLGFLFISLSTLLLLLEYHFSTAKAKKGEVASAQPYLLGLGFIKMPEPIFIWMLAGWLTGFAFGIKYIAILNYIGLIAYLCYTRVDKRVYAGFLGLALGGVFLLRIDRFAGIDLGDISPLLIAAVFILPSVTVLFYSLRESVEALKNLLLSGLIFSLFFLLAYSPWAIKHLSENQSFSISSIIEGKSPRPKILINPDYLSEVENSDTFNQPKIEKARAKLIAADEQTPNSSKKSKAELADQKEEKKLSAGEQTRREELHRYLGFESGLPLYLSMPYDLTMSINFPGHKYLDIGFLFLLLLPLLLLSTGNKSQWKNLVLFLLISFLMIMALQAIYGGSEGFNSAAAMQRINDLLAQSSLGVRSTLGGVYKGMMYLLFAITSIFTPLFVLLSKMNFLLVLLSISLLLGLVFWLAEDRLKSMSPGLKALSGFLLSFLILWVFLGNGIPWYGFPALSLLPVLLVYAYTHSEELLGNGQKVFFRYFFSITVALYFGMNLISHFYSHDNGANAHIFFKTPFIRYAGEQLNKRKVLAKFNPFFPSTTKILNSDLKAKVYRVGTYINYHIKQNDRRVLEDNQLGLFDDVSSNTGNPGYFLQVLKENGFRYIIYDLRTASIDMTPEKSLTKKNQAFLNQLLNSGQAELLVTDRIVEDPTGNKLKIRGFTFDGKAGLLGKAVYQGSFALFEIK